MNDIIVRALEIALKDAGQKCADIIVRTQNSRRQVDARSGRRQAEELANELVTACNAYDAIAAELEIASRQRTMAFNAINSGAVANG